MKSVQSSTSDIISTLPSNITENILMCLPLRDAVRTSVLSSRWKYKWVTLPKLIFDEKFCQESLGNRQLKTIIYQVLLLHNGPLVKFKLFVPQFKSCLDINHWILILLKKNIQKFTLYLCSGQHHKIPFHLFLFLQLRHLNLTTCIFEPPPTFKGFSMLVKLDFVNVVIVHEMFGNFISNCPLLERLILDGCSTFDCLEINAPNLKYFLFSGIFKSICFSRTALLAVISVSLCSLDANSKQYEEREDSNFIKFFHCLPAIENLTLDEQILEFLAVGSVPKSLPNTMNHLKILNLCCISFHKLDEVSCALCLIRSSPNLQKLEIITFTDSVNLEAVTELLQAQDLSKFSLSRLQKVKMLFSGMEPEMEFVKLLLACSTALEKMEILPVEENQCKEEFEVLKKLARFPRASPKAELIFLDS